MRPAVSRAERLLHAMDDPLARGVLGFGAAFAVTVLLLVLNILVLAFVALGVAATLCYASYRRNERHCDLRAPLSEAWSAAIEALGENGFVFGEPSWFGSTEGRIEAGDAKVIVEKHPGGYTRVRVRVGLFDTDDNRRRAGLVVESIEKRAA